MHRYRSSCRPVYIALTMLQERNEDFLLVFSSAPRSVAPFWLYDRTCSQRSFCSVWPFLRVESIQLAHFGIMLMDNQGWLYWSPTGLCLIKGMGWHSCPKMAWNGRNIGHDPQKGSQTKLFLAFADPPWHSMLVLLRTSHFTSWPMSQNPNLLSFSFRGCLWSSGF